MKNNSHHGLQFYIYLFNSERALSPKSVQSPFTINLGGLIWVGKWVQLLHDIFPCYINI
jgi:hypothetical protein